MRYISFIRDFMPEYVKNLIERIWEYQTRLRGRTNRSPYFKWNDPEEFIHRISTVIGNFYRYFNHYQNKITVYDIMCLYIIT